jgi:hypothetical protein
MAQSALADGGDLSLDSGLPCLSAAGSAAEPAQHRAVRAAGQAIARRIDPEREVRAAREQLEIADTAASHIALGDALAQAGDHRTAGRHYESALARQPAADRSTLLKLASALLEQGEAQRALATLERAPAPGSSTAADQQAFLRARILEAAGRREEALALYRDVSERLAGEEALCRYAALCLELGHRAEGRSALEKVEFKARRLSKVERAVRGEMYDWAARTLADLRS